MAKPILSTKTGTGAKLLQYAESVLAKTTENSSIFSDPIPTMNELELKIQTFKNSMTEASFRDMRQVILKNQHAIALKQTLYNLSLYVETVAQGDPAIVIAAGFIPSKPTTNVIGVSPKPSDLRAEVIHVGTNSIRLRVNAWRPARFYQFEYRLFDSVDNWTSVLSTKSKMLMTNLKYLYEYEFRVSYLGSDPRLNYSDVVRCVVV